MKPRATFFLITADALYDKKDYLGAYREYTKSLKALEQDQITDSIHAKLGILKCKIAANLIDLKEANKQLEELKQNAIEVADDALTQSIKKNLHSIQLIQKNPKKMTNHLLSYAGQLSTALAQAANIPINHDIFANDNNRNEETQKIAITLHMLGLNNVEEKILLINNTMSKLRAAKSIYQDKNLLKSAKQCALILIELQETLADCHFDSAKQPTLTVAEKTRAVTLAAEHYAATIASQQKTGHDVPMLLHLSLLNSWEELAKTDPENASNYARKMRDYITTHDLEREAKNIKNKDEREAQQKALEAHNDFYRNLLRKRIVVDISCDDDHSKTGDEDVALMPAAKRQKTTETANAITAEEKQAKKADSDSNTTAKFITLFGKQILLPPRKVLSAQTTETAQQPVSNAVVVATTTTTTTTTTTATQSTIIALDRTATTIHPIVNATMDYNDDGIPLQQTRKQKPTMLFGKNITPDTVDRVPLQHARKQTITMLFGKRIKPPVLDQRPVATNTLLASTATTETAATAPQSTHTKQPVHAVTVPDYAVAFKQAIEKFFQLFNPKLFHRSEILRELARFHRKFTFAQHPYTDIFATSQFLCEKALIIEADSSYANNELAEQRVLQPAYAANSYNRTKERQERMDRYKAECAKNPVEFFWMSLDKYLVRLEKVIPNHHQQILAAALEHLSTSEIVNYMLNKYIPKDKHSQVAEIFSSHAQQIRPVTFASCLSKL